MENDNHRRPQLGYIIMSGSIIPILVVSLMYLYLSYPPIVLLGAIPPAAALLVIGYRRLSPGKGNGSLSDEQQMNRNKAGNRAFIILLSIISIDAFFEFLPVEGARIIYLTTGSVVVLLYYFYFKHFE